MAENLKTKWVGTDTRQQLVERNHGLVEEVIILRQHVADMYRVWMDGKAPPPPPPSFMGSVLTHTLNPMPDDPPRFPYIPAYHSFSSSSSSSITHPPSMFSQCYSRPQHHYSPRGTQNHASPSWYPNHNAPLSQVYRNPPSSGFWSNRTSKNERLQRKKIFTPLGESNASLFQRLRKLGMLKPIKIKMSNPFPKKFNLFQRCVYCLDAMGHDLETCWSLKNAIQKLIDKGNIVVPNTNATNTGQSPSPVHSETRMAGMIDRENKPAEVTQKPFSQNNVIKICENSNNLGMKFSG